MEQKKELPTLPSLQEIAEMFIKAIETDNLDLQQKADKQMEKLVKLKSMKIRGELWSELGKIMGHEYAE